MAKKMTPKQQRFVEEYRLDMNATQAAIRAGYSEKTAQEQGSRLLSNVMIATAIKEAEEQHLTLLGVRNLTILSELATIGYSDIRHYRIDDDGYVQLQETAPDYAMRAVSGFKRKVFIRTVGEEEHRTVETDIRLWNKNNAIELLAKHRGLLIEKIAHTDPTGTKEYGTGDIPTEERALRILAFYEQARTRGRQAAAEPEPAAVEPTTGTSD